MRIFWSLILVLIIAAGVIVFAHERDRAEASRARVVTQNAVPPPAAPAVAPQPKPVAVVAEPPVETSPPVAKALPQAEEESVEAKPERVAPVEEPGAKQVIPAVKIDPAPEPRPVAEDPAPQKTVATGEEALRLADEFFRSAFQREKAVATPPRGPAEPPAGEPVDAPTDQQKQPEAKVGNEPAPAVNPKPESPPPANAGATAGAAPPKEAERKKVVIAETLAVDDRFVLRGKGTKADPYRITWEQLASAYESYRPKEGRTEIPEHIRMLHDKHVKITGYMTLPLAAGEAKELLLMLNQWDGCCIGVPPSPYDSIEVKLTKPVDPSQLRFASRGSVSGLFKVDPYVVNNWLVGLYMMESAELELWM